MVVFATLMRKFFENKVGEFLRVEEGNYHFSGSSVRLTQAEIKEDVFDELHLPITLRGGFIDEMSAEFSVGMFSSGGAQVVIKNVFFVLGPHKTDWSWDHVYKCKSRLIDLVMKIYELKPSKKKKAGSGASGSVFADMQKRMISDMKRTFLSMLEVHISNVHFRYEDAVTQTSPLACGFKIGYIGVASKEETQDRRTTGDWKQWSERHADPEFCQSIATRRISAYWDIGKARDSLFATQPVPGQEVKRNFVRLNHRETFSACVVDKVLELFPPEHARRKYLQGPVFRERLDFHRYVLFPSSLRAEVTANRVCDATDAQKAPLKDLDVVFDPLEFALDSEQVRSMNQLLTYASEFVRMDSLLRTRPRETIRTYLAPRGGGQPRIGPTASFSNLAMRSNRNTSRGSAGMQPPQAQGQRRDEGPQDTARRDLVREWWRHAYSGVQLLCKIPKSRLGQQDLLERTKLRESYVNLCIDASGEAPGYTAEVQETTSLQESAKEQLKGMQMRLPLRDIFEWRMLARERMEKQDRSTNVDEDAREEEEGAAKDATEKQLAAPNTLQAHVHFVAFHAYFLGVADHFWRSAMSGRVSKEDSTAVVDSGGGAATSSSGPASRSARRPPLTRQLVVKGQVLDVRIQVVQKGRSHHRIARWLELEVGSVGTTNCNVKGPDHSTGQILNIMPIEQHRGSPVCAFVGLTTLEAFARDLEPGDAPLGAVLQPWQGLASHLKSFPQEETPEQLKRLGFLRDCKDDLGKLMTFAFVRVGQVRALDYTPFRRRILHFLARGRASQTTDLVRRPSPMALDRELLVRLQRNVEKLTGKSHMMGILEGEIDGVRARLVDHYNSQHVLCKEVSLAPMRWKALRSGKPQAFHLQFHQLPQAGERQQQALQLPSIMAAAQGDSFSLLPWKVAMLLLPKADFAMGLDPAPPGDGEQSGADTVVGPGSDAGDAAALLAGCTFWKWGRNGKPKQRFVVFDESLNAIVWKNLESDKQPIGAIPLSKIQDICTGVQTPVMQRVRSPKLCADRVLSIIATDRTLDLQAESAAYQQCWVAGLKARYRRHVQQQHVEGEAAVQLPKALEKRAKVYPERFRSDRCTLQSTYMKLQAVTSLGRSLRSASAPESEGGNPPQALRVGA